MTEHSSASGWSRWRVVFEVTSTLLMVVLASSLLWVRSAAPAVSSASSGYMPLPQVPRQPIVIGSSPVRGARTAKVAIVEYADFTCSACVAFARDIEPGIRTEYIDPGLVVHVFKLAPRKSTSAQQTAIDGWCAAEHGKFWQMHDRLFTPPEELPVVEASDLREVMLKAAIEELGLDKARYNQCRSGPEAKAQVEADRAEAAALKVPGTPTFFFGTVSRDRVTATDVMVGTKSLARFKEILDRLTK